MSFGSASFQLRGLGMAVSLALASAAAGADPLLRTEAEDLLTAPAEDVRAALLDLEGFGRWFPTLVEWRVLSRGESEARVYGRQRFPWPARDRDYVARYRWWTEGEGFRLEAVGEVAREPAALPGVERLERFRSEWRVEPDASGGSRTRYVAEGAVDGRLARWLAQLAWRSQTRRVLDALAGELDRREAARARASRAERYRLGEAEGHWDRAGDDAILDDLQPRYPELFETVVTPGREVEREALALRADLERQPADRRNFDALNALAIAYFEMNYRAEQARAGTADLSYLSLSFQSAKILAVPWRAYSLVSEGTLRDAILDFFEDAGSGRKLGTAATAPRVASIVASLEAKEADPARQARIRDITRAIVAAAEASREAEEPAASP